MVKSLTATQNVKDSIIILYKTKNFKMKCLSFDRESTKIKGS